MPDKFTAVWTSHTSISDFLKCPRAYYLKNVYRDPNTKHKIKIISPSMALGQAVHEVLESLSVLPKDKRFEEPLMSKFERAWDKLRGKKGGFLDLETENKTKQRGQEMLRRVIKNPGPVSKAAVKIQADLPYFWLSEEENIILCGKIDWLEYIPESDNVHIIDFKTGKNEEDSDSLQLPIYHLLVHNCQKRKVERASYWYLDHNDDLTTKELPDLDTARKQVLNVAQQMKLARQLSRFKCPDGEDGCSVCRPLEAVFNHQSEFVGTDDFNYDVYILPAKKVDQMESVIL